MRRVFLLAILFAPFAAQAQWQLLDAHTTADLRGIDNVGKGVVWVSGTNGTVLRSEDDGYMWQGCAVPPGAEKLDFRGIQGFDANVAIVMSSGVGEASRLYKTTDGCQSWKLLFVNPDKDGFWDALVMNDQHNGWLLGDPIEGSFVLGQTNDGGSGFNGIPRSSDWKSLSTFQHLQADGRGAFAASNSSLAMRPFTRPKNPCSFPLMWFGTSGPHGAKIFRLQRQSPQCADYGTDTWTSADVGIGGEDSNSGVFSIAARDDDFVVAVGGDYKRPSDSTKTAAFATDGGMQWHSATTMPQGYRSAVAYYASSKMWITVGPNGTDVSVNDGRNWRALKPDMRVPGAQVDEDQRWNALSLPFVVGPGGRIGMLRPEALKGR
jgi:hypothetical protein